MVNFSPPQIDSTFHALSDPTRRAILMRLSHGDITVTELAKPFNSSLPAISKHIKVLEEAKLVKRRKDGRIHHISLDLQVLRETTEWMEQQCRVWDAQRVALAWLVEDAPRGFSGLRTEEDPEAVLIPPSDERCDP
ncbi:winged helix-turn-helix transcriptional regulator [candidate division KSB1 bacterium]|nr:winged helix-turn-helix transcriptional regulator [candidate division KSB1 bacterium]